MTTRIVVQKPPEMGMSEFLDHAGLDEFDGVQIYLGGGDDFSMDEWRDVKRILDSKELDTIVHLSNPYTMEDLENAKHIHELPRRETNTVNIDYKQRGVGGDSFVFPIVHDEYKLLKGKKYIYSFRIRPLSAGKKDIKELIKYNYPN